MEAAYASVLEDIQIAEKHAQRLRKDNDALIRNQKRLQDRESELRSKCEQIRRLCAEEVIISNLSSRYLWRI